MARRRKKRTLKPRVPARVKKRPRKGKREGHQHPELIGLALLALGLFLATVLYLGWSGGMVGGWFAGGFPGDVGAAAYVMPLAFVAIGWLMVARSELVDMRPFRTGLAVTTFGLLTTLGSAHGGAIGGGFGHLFGLLLGGTGTTILGVLTLVIGPLLLTGASAGGPLPPPGGGGRAQAPPPAAARPPAAGFRGARPAQPLRRDARDARRVPAARSRNPQQLSAPKRRRGRCGRANRRRARPDAVALRRRGDDRRPDRGAARHALRAAARARYEGLEGRSAQGRPLVRARHDGDPDPRADPGQAGRRRRAPEPAAEPRDARRHLRRAAVDGEPAGGVARQGHLRRRRLDRPRADAAPSDRRDDGLGQVGLHQHAPDLDPPALDSRRCADDPHRPKAHRARVLRVDSAPADACRLVAEAGGGSTRERRHRDGAPLREALDRSRAEPRGGEPLAAAARRADVAVSARRDRRARR